MLHPNVATPPPTTSRPVGNTENGWCKAVPTGTGTSVLTVLLNKPADSSLLRSAIHGLLSSHPMIRSKLRYDAKSNSFSIVITPSPDSLPDITLFDVNATSKILHRSPDSAGESLLSSFLQRNLQIPPDLLYISSFSGGCKNLGSNNIKVIPIHLVIEHELNRNPWKYTDRSKDSEVDVFHATLYVLSEKQCALALRVHVAAFDCVGVASLFRTLMLILTGGGGGGGAVVGVGDDKVSPAIEDLLPRRKGKKKAALWARGVNLLGYSLSSLRMENLNFVNARSARSSAVVRFKMNLSDTHRLVTGCKSRGIKLCGVLTAAALMAAHVSKNLSKNKKEKYGVVTLMDCRSLLDPPLPANSLGFYHSAILNSVDVTGKESLWDLAVRIYSFYTIAKNGNKHFSDMADLTFLMCKAIDNPGLTPSSSLRTALLTVYEDPIEFHERKVQQEIGIEDYVVCSSGHGIGPSMALFDSIRDGELDCVCVYPSPLHSKEQMQALIDDMRRFLVNNDNVEI